MTRFSIALLVCLLPGAVLACEKDEKPVLTCRAYTNKQIEICQGPSAISYRYGPPGKLRLVASQENKAIVWSHGEGVSTGIMDDLIFTKAGTKYVITHVAAFNDPSISEARIGVIASGVESEEPECISAIRFTPKNIKLRAQEPSPDGE